MTIAFAICVLASASQAAAQILQRPECPIRGSFGAGRPPDPNRVRQELVLNVSSLGGYDDNPTPPGNVAGSAVVWNVHVSPAASD